MLYQPNQQKDGMFLDAYTKSLGTIRNKNLVAKRVDQNLLMGFLNASHWSDETRAEDVRYILYLFKTSL
jgi:hypothetical protein